MIKKLVAVEFTVDEDCEELELGEKYSYFVDPVTGKYYRPIDGFEITGDNLNDLFVEVESD
jgi:hypothetical protein